MFAALNQLNHQVPQFETRKALLVINCQNDALYHLDDFYVTHNVDYVKPLRELIPYFRRVGNIIWVRTEMGVLPTTPSPDAERVEKESTRQAEANRKTRNQEEAHLKDDTQDDDRRRAQLARIDPAGTGPLPTYDPSSRIKQIMTRASADTRSGTRSTNLQTLDGDDDSLEQRLVKPRKGQRSRFFIAGTKGAEICDELIDLVDPNDMHVTKHFYSAFDQTSLLMSLRMQLITEVYLAGGLTNASVYSTAADAVQHGLTTTLVEDCLGWRSEAKHEQALQEMQEIMGVPPISSDELIESSGGRDIPDAETPGITLQELSLTTEAKEAQTALLAQSGRGVYAVDGRHDLLLGKQSASANPRPASSDSPIKSVAHAIPGSSANSRLSYTKPKGRMLGPADMIGSGDSRIVLDFLTENVHKTFDQVKTEVEWRKMGHRGGQVPRLVAVQGEINKAGDLPIYRHPADESPPLLSFTATIRKIKREVEVFLNQPFNHALIQLYRGGEDNISEHSDKTLDIVRGSSIVNVSLGAERVMTLRTKKSSNTQTGSESPMRTDSPSVRNTQRISMPDNSIFILGPQTNREWLHGVRADKRPFQEKTEQEKAYDGERISITFRQIGTFMNQNAQTIWGTGARNKSRSKAGKIVNDPSQMEAMIIAFGKENHQADFDWDAGYGQGFDAVNLNMAKGPAKLVLSSDSVANFRVQILLEELSINYEVIEQEASQRKEKVEKPFVHGLTNTYSPILSGVGSTSTPIEGDLRILIHLEKHHQSSSPSAESQKYTNAQLYSCIAQANELLYIWYELCKNLEDGSHSFSPTARYNIENKRPPTPVVSLREELLENLKGWEEELRKSRYPFMAGDYWSIIDCALWPVFNSILNGIVVPKDKYPKLFAYHNSARERPSVQKIFRGRQQQGGVDPPKSAFGSMNGVASR